MPGGLTDWITAASTALTGIFAGIASAVAWVSLTRDGKSILPVVDPSCERREAKDHPEALFVALNITNRSNETLRLHSIEIKRPKRVQMAFANVSPGGKRSVADIQNPPVLVDLTMRPCGAKSQIFDQWVPHDVERVEFYIFPRKPFRAQEAHIALKFSSSALTIRDKRMVISMRVPPRKQSNKDATTSSQA